MVTLKGRKLGGMPSKPTSQPRNEWRNEWMNKEDRFNFDLVRQAGRDIMDMKDVSKD